MSSQQHSGSGSGARPTNTAFSDTVLDERVTDGQRPSAVMPAKLSRYELIEAVGAGGFGSVYAAHDPVLNRKVAIKLLHRRQRSAETGHTRDHILEERRAQQRLLREAHALARLSHPNIVPVFDVGTYALDDAGVATTTPADDSEPLHGVFMVMEFIDGLTIGEWIKQTDPDWRAIVNVFLAAGSGLAAAHAKGFVHRDFKPANVLVSRDGKTVKVVDFGLWRAKEMADAPSKPIPTRVHALELANTSVTRSDGRVAGTPAYMAPEQHLGMVTGPFTDQFSFCLSLHESLFGASPFPGETTLERISSMLRELHVDAPKGTQIPTALHDALRCGLSFRPAERHVSVRALLSVLANILEQRPETPITAATLPPRPFTEDDTSPQEANAIRNCIRDCEPGIFLYWEVPYPTVHALKLMREQLDALTKDGFPYALIVDISRAVVPATPEVRAAILQMFRDTHLMFTAVAAADPMMRMAATFIMDGAMPAERWGIYESYEIAIANARTVLGRS